MNMPVSMVPGIGLTEAERAQLEALANAMSPEHVMWASGFLAGVAHARLQTANAPAGLVTAAPTAASETTLAILYASETGNAAELARRIEARARAMGLTAFTSDLASYKTRNLKDERLIVLISSTHGEGEPPEPAAGFFEFINGRKAPKLDGARFAVLALGDSTYEFYCEAAKILDRRFEELGAKRFHDRLDCDVDYEEPADVWIGEVLEKLKADQPAQKQMPMVGPAIVSAPAPHDKRNPFLAEVIDNFAITGRDSSKETRHLEFAIADSGLIYAPGDALGIVPRNDPALIDEVLEQAGLTGGEHLATKSGETSLADALSRHYEITALTPKFLQHWSELSGAGDLGALARGDDRKALADYMYNHHVIDVMRHYPVHGLEPAQFVVALRGLQPRLYSISSSQLAASDEVHITVSSVRYNLNDTGRMGVASCFLADRVKPDDTVPVYVQRNDNFRMPQDSAMPIIMIGAGTGVAPYRAFVQEREIGGASGESWLFFGERNFRSDFLYQLEWQDWLKSGVLTRMSVAFSRDQETKRYIQHEMLDQGRDLFNWLEDGAHLYLCGDAEKLAPDVHEALTSIVETHGGMTRENADEYLRGLQRDGRYQRDVY